MIVKQKNLRVFHIKIEDNRDFLEYFIKNKILLKEFFLLLEGNVDIQTKSFLDEAKVCYKFIDDCSIRLANVKQELHVEQDEKKAVKKFETEKLEIEKEKLRVFNRPIRSGEEINEDLPLVIFGRINSGAKLICTQSATIYGIIDGLVQCDGDFIILKGISNHGNLIFNGEIIDKDILKDDVLQQISINASVVEVKEIC